MSRIRDWESRFHAKVLSSDRGYIPNENGWPSRGETSLQVVVEGAISGNTIQPQGRLKDQTAWQNIGSAIAGAAVGTTVDVSKYDEHRMQVTGFMGTGSVSEVQTLTPSAAPTSGAFKLQFGALLTTSLAFNASAADIQAALRLLAGLDLVTVSGTLATAVVVTFTGYKGNAAALSAPGADNTLLETATPVTIGNVQTTPGVAGADVTVIASGFYS